jgi:hypothetical protein
MPYGMYINEYNLIGISCNHKWLKKNYEGEWLHLLEGTKRKQHHIE